MFVFVEGLLVRQFRGRPGYYADRRRADGPQRRVHRRGADRTSGRNSNQRADQRVPQRQIGRQ